MRVHQRHDKVVKGKKIFSDILRIYDAIAMHRFKNKL